ncbi:hypothetical protein [Spiribacter pallidus]
MPRKKDFASSSSGSPGVHARTLSESEAEELSEVLTSLELENESFQFRILELMRFMEEMASEIVRLEDIILSEEASDHRVEELRCQLSIVQDELRRLHATRLMRFTYPFRKFYADLRRRHASK